MRRGLQGCLPGGCRGVSPPPDPTSLATALSARAGAISKPDGAATARDGTPASAAGGGGGTRNSGGADRTERTGTEKVGSLPSLVSRTASAMSLPTSRRPPARTHTSSIGEWSNAGWKQVPLSAPPPPLPSTCLYATLWVLMPLPSTCLYATVWVLMPLLLRRRQANSHVLTWHVTKQPKSDGHSLGSMTARAASAKERELILNLRSVTISTALTTHVIKFEYHLSRLVRRAARPRTHDPSRAARRAGAQACASSAAAHPFALPRNQVHLEILAKQNATVRLSFVDERRYTYRFATAREAQGFCAVLRSAWRRPTSERKEDPRADGGLPLRPSSSDKTFKIWVGTFNMGAAAPPKDPAVLRLWMQPEQRTPHPSLQ